MSNTLGLYRVKLTELPLPEGGHRPEKWPPSSKGASFETKPAARLEDLLRARRLRATADRGLLSPADAIAAYDLADRLVRGAKGETVPPTPASKVASARFRRRLGGSLSQLLDNDGWGEAYFITGVPADLRISAGELCRESPCRLMDRLKSTLREMGAANVDGWALFGLHGEFDGTTGQYTLHWHAIVKGELAELCSQLVQRRKYLPATHKRALPGAIKQPIRKIPISPDERAVLTYPAQSFWPDRPLGSWDGETLRRMRGKMRIDEPHHSEVLLWMDRWNFPDFFLLIGLCATSDGLVRTSNFPR